MGATVWNTRWPKGKFSHVLVREICSIIIQEMSEVFRFLQIFLGFRQALKLSTARADFCSDSVRVCIIISQVTIHMHAVCSAQTGLLNVLRSLSVIILKVKFRMSRERNEFQDVSLHNSQGSR